MRASQFAIKRPNNGYPIKGIDFKRQIVDVLTKLSGLQVSGNEYKSAVETAEQLVLALDPLHETGWRSLIRALP